MKPWHRKLLLDTVKAVTPFQATLRELKRRHVPYATSPENDAGLLADGIHQIRMLREAGVAIADTTVLEFGSGWLPVVPMLFRIAGAKSVTLTDQEQLLDRALIRQAAAFVQANADQVEAGLGVSRKLIDDRLRPALADDGDVEATLGRCGMRYLVPFALSGVPQGSMDIVVSRAVLEHVSEPVLRQFISGFRQILRPGGAMCHIIDMSDHWEHSDKSISRVNFLKFSDRAWQFTWLNPQNIQNRLRRYEYVRLFQDTGFEILKAEGQPHAATLEALRTLPLARRFQSVPKEELAVVTCAIVARATG